jgi:uncharacterized membrane protein YhaH (DUF805 family)
MQWYIKVLKQYADFSGRARRTEFWMFVLINFLVSIVLGIIDSLIGTATVVGSSGMVSFSPGLLGGIYGLAVLIPSLAVGCRRLHDTDRTGWWQLIAVIPLIGAIVLIVFWAQDGQRMPNKYGVNPKMVGAGANPAMPV